MFQLNGLRFYESAFWGRVDYERAKARDELKAKEEARSERYKALGTEPPVFRHKQRS